MSPNEQPKLSLDGPVPAPVSREMRMNVSILRRYAEAQAALTEAQRQLAAGTESGATDEELQAAAARIRAARANLSSASEAQETLTETLGDAAQAIAKLQLREYYLDVKLKTLADATDEKLLQERDRLLEMRLSAKEARALIESIPR